MLKVLGVLIGPTGGHYHHSSPMDLLAKETGGRQRQSKGGPDGKETLMCFIKASTKACHPALGGVLLSLTLLIKGQWDLGCVMATKGQQYNISAQGCKEATWFQCQEHHVSSHRPQWQRQQPEPRGQRLLLCQGLPALSVPLDISPQVVLSCPRHEPFSLQPGDIQPASPPQHLPTHTRDSLCSLPLT